MTKSLLQGSHLVEDKDKFSKKRSKVIYPAMWCVLQLQRFSRVDGRTDFANSIILMEATVDVLLGYTFLSSQLLKFCIMKILKNIQK
jgi:hypothetical protein